MSSRDQRMMTSIGIGSKRWGERGFPWNVSQKDRGSGLEENSLTTHDTRALYINWQRLHCRGSCIYNLNYIWRRIRLYRAYVCYSWNTCVLIRGRKWQVYIWRAPWWPHRWSLTDGMCLHLSYLSRSLMSSHVLTFLSNYALCLYSLRSNRNDT